jgi:hypothetical protein
MGFWFLQLMHESREPHLVGLVSDSTCPTSKRGISALSSGNQKMGNAHSGVVAQARLHPLAKSFTLGCSFSTAALVTPSEGPRLRATPCPSQPHFQSFPNPFLSPAQVSSEGPIEQFGIVFRQGEGYVIVAIPLGRTGLL